MRKYNINNKYARSILSSKKTFQRCFMKQVKRIFIAAVGIAPQARRPLHLFFYEYYFGNGFITALAKKAFSQFFSKAICLKEMLY